MQNASDRLHRCQNFAQSWQAGQVNTAGKAMGRRLQSSVVPVRPTAALALLPPAGPPRRAPAVPASGVASSTTWSHHHFDAEDIGGRDRVYERYFVRLRMTESHQLGTISRARLRRVHRTQTHRGLQPHAPERATIAVNVHRIGRGGDSK
jgi:hypothetical protein